MFFYLGLILVALANGIYIPSVIWWFFGIDTFFRIINGIFQVIKKQYER